MLTMRNTKKDFEQATCTTAILPVGALEQHGSHLPVGTDTIIAEELAGRIAAKLDAYLLPALPITSSIEHRDGPGTVYLRATTLALVIRDIADSLRHAGYRRLILVNFHGGNWMLKPTIRQLNRDYADSGSEMRTILLYTPGIPDARVAAAMEHPQGDIHAGEFETSIMLALAGGDVGDIRPQSRPTDAWQDEMDYFDTIELTEDGYWGFPEAATAAKGERLIELQVDIALRYLARLEARIREAREKRGVTRPAD